MQVAYNKSQKKSKVAALDSKVVELLTTTLENVKSPYLDVASE